MPLGSKNIFHCKTETSSFGKPNVNGAQHRDKKVTKTVDKDLVVNMEMGMVLNMVKLMANQVMAQTTTEEREKQNSDC